MKFLRTYSRHYFSFNISYILFRRVEPIYILIDNYFLNFRFTWLYSAFFIVNLKYFFSHYLNHFVIYLYYFSTNYFIIKLINSHLLIFSYQSLFYLFADLYPSTTDSFNLFLV